MASGVFYLRCVGCSGHNWNNVTHAATFWMTRYQDYVKEKDVQMLAMLSMLVLQTELGAILSPSISRVKDSTPTTAVPLRMAGLDYFSLTKSAVNLFSPSSPDWPRFPSSPVAPSFSSSNSSRGSWSSLFNAGTMRQFMNGVQDTWKEGLLTPTEIVPSYGISTVATRSTEKLGRTGSDLAVGALRQRRMRQGSLLHTQTPTTPKSWNDGVRQPSKPLLTSFSSAGHRQHLRFRDSSSFINENQVVVFGPDCLEDTVNKPLFDLQLMEQFKLNVYVYAELLFRWQLFHKRLELLKAVNRQPDGLVPNTVPYHIGLLRLCPRSDCRAILPEKSNICRHCSTSCVMPKCTICRFPVKGLFRALVWVARM
ncbi:hypothetical protein BYT27DRAFT_7246637 [Phlegmacium glaucopus]|nr:hypothetical protein BYT27DRAFT_7246637 [Phlegmacium glaucopus]